MDVENKVRCLNQILFGAPQLFCQRNALGPMLCPCILVQGAGLQNLLWGLWACSTRGIVSVWQLQAVQVGAQSAVTSALSEVGGLLVTLEVVHLAVRWRAVLGLPLGVQLPFDQSFGFIVGDWLVWLL